MKVVSCDIFRFLPSSAKKTRNATHTTAERTNPQSARMIHTQPERRGGRVAGLVPAGTGWFSVTILSSPLCLERWKEALEAGAAPPVVLAATHVSALEFFDRGISRRRQSILVDLAG